ncbi:MAG: hypothetical protein JWR10_3403 [Rubritepida sp.]|nr:hypothetical protein [Rubritepida sp.]
MTAPVRLRLSRERGSSLAQRSRSANGLPAVVVARPGRWGNPFRIGHMWTRDRIEPGGGTKGCGPVANAEEAVRLFRRFTARETAYRIAAHQTLRGKNLACWCRLDQACHADVLLEISNA